MDAYHVIIQTHTFTRKIEKFLLEIYIYKFEKFHRTWWLMPVIPALWEAVVGES